MNLTREQVLLDKLGNPERNLKIVHVAGTKGKGSTCTMLAEIAHAAGYTVGLFTSPHILSINERIRINNNPCTEDEFNRWLSVVEPVVKTMDRENPELGAVTFFEILTAMAFLGFVERKTDLVVLETGLGGRLDSTNVCSPIATAITSIGLDHIEVLGDTEAKIAREKAGIIKPGVPVVVGSMDVSPRQVIESVARQNNALTIEAGRDFFWMYQPEPYSLAGQITCGEYKSVYLALPGEHQSANAAIALQLVKILNQSGFVISDSDIRRALKSIRIPGRIDTIRTNPQVIIDAAHNPNSIAVLVKAIARLNLPRKQCGLVFACADDKDAHTMFSMLYPYFANWFITQFSNNPRAYKSDKLREIFSQVQNELSDKSADNLDTVETFDCSKDAIQAALQFGGQLVCIAGSFYLASEAYREFNL